MKARYKLLTASHQLDQRRNLRGSRRHRPPSTATSNGRVYKGSTIKMVPQPPGPGQKGQKIWVPQTGKQSSTTGVTRITQPTPAQALNETAEERRRRCRSQASSALRSVSTNRARLALRW